MLLVFGGQDELFKGIDFNMPLLSLYASSNDVYKVYVGLGEVLLIGYVLYKLYEDKKLSSMIKAHWKQILSFAAIVFIAGSLLVMTPSIKRVIVTKPNAWSFYFTVLETVIVTSFIAVLPIAYVIKYLVRTFDKKKLAVCIVVVLLLQFDNIQAVYTSHRSGEYVVDYYELKLKDTDFWNKIAANDDIRELVFMYDASDDDLVRWAVDNDKKIVNGAFSQESHSELFGERLEEPDDSAVFVFKADDKSFDYMSYNELNYYRADGYVVGYVNELVGAENESVAANELCTRIFAKDSINMMNTINIFGLNYLIHDGYSFGPYCHVDEYEYLIEIKGYNLQDNVEVLVYSEKEDYEYTLVESTNDKITLRIDVDEPADSLEIYVKNNSWGLIRIDNYLLMPLDE